MKVEGYSFWAGILPGPLNQRSFPGVVSTLRSLFRRRSGELRAIEIRALLGISADKRGIRPGSSGLSAGLC